MGLKYNPLTGKLLRTSTPKLVTGCPGEPDCSETQVRLIVSGVGDDEFNCGAGCSAFNGTFVLLPDPAAILQHAGDAGCGIVGNSFWDEADYVCGYSVDFTACGETWTWDALLFGRYTGPEAHRGWMMTFGFHSPGSYNFGGGGEADSYYVHGSTVGATVNNIDYPSAYIYLPGTGLKLDFPGYTFTDPETLCGLKEGGSCIFFNVASFQVSAIESIP